jgi:two-component system, response regulator PdtaR
VKPYQKSDLIPAIELAVGRHRELVAMASDISILEEQIETRKIVDRAKGLLIDTHGMKEADAFAFIQRTAMSERTRMRDISDRIIAGTLAP